MVGGGGGALGGSPGRGGRGGRSAFGCILTPVWSSPHPWTLSWGGPRAAGGQGSPPALRLVGCVTWGQPLSLSEPRLPTCGLRGGVSTPDSVCEAETWAWKGSTAEAEWAGLTLTQASQQNGVSTSRSDDVSLWPPAYPFSPVPNIQLHQHSLCDPGGASHPLCASLPSSGRWKAFYHLP